MPSSFETIKGFCFVKEIKNPNEANIIFKGSLVLMEDFNIDRMLNTTPNLIV